MSKYSVSTPIDTFQHQGTGSVIDIVSTVHIGESHYYRSLGNYVMARQDEGFAVQYEGISQSENASQPLGRVDNFKHRLVESVVDTSFDTIATVLANSDYVAQPEDELFYEKGSTNIDVSQTIRAEQMGVFAQLGSLRRAKRLHRRILKAAETKDGYQFSEYVFGLIKGDVDSSVGVKKRPRKLGDRFTIVTRNDVALDGVDSALEANPSAKIVLVWGLGHLAGLGTGLINRDYEHVDSKDITVTFSPTIGQRQITKEQKKLDKMKAKVQASAVKQGWR